MERKINAAAFKAQCLALIDEVAESGQPITITKRGKAKVQLVAVREKPKTLVGRHEGHLQDRRRYRGTNRRRIRRRSRMAKYHRAIR